MKYKIRQMPFLILLLFINACENSDSKISEKHLEPQKVRIYQAVMRQDTGRENITGSVKPKLKSSIEAKISGTIEKILAKPGQYVEEGEILVELNVNEIKAKLDQALAVEEQAFRDLKRFSSLLKQQALTQQEYDSMEAKTRIARATVLEAKTMLDYAKVKAPFKGVVTQKHVNVGDLASPGRPLFELEDSSTLRFDASIPETLINNIKLGDQVPVFIGGHNTEITGTAAEISPTADPNSRTFTVKFDLPKNSGIRSGQFGRAVIPATGTERLVVPTKSLIKRGQMEIVFVVDKDKAFLRLVRTGQTFADEIELISGVEPGEFIVIENADKLRDLQPIEVIK